MRVQVHPGIAKQSHPAAPRALTATAALALAPPPQTKQQQQ